jgi:peroxiredoxin
VDAVVIGMRLSTFLLLCCALLSAQTDTRETRGFSVTRASAAGTVTIHLRNNYSASATAWVLQCTGQGGSRYYWMDQDLSFETKPVAPGEEIEFKITPPPRQAMAQSVEAPQCEDFHPVAAVFADGTVSGALDWINAIVADRRQAYQDIGKATEMLNAAISNGTDAAGIVQQLTDWQKARVPGGLGARPGRPTMGARFGWQSDGTGPSEQRLFRTPVPGVALWLIDTQKKPAEEAVKALAGWRDRLAKLASVSAAEGPMPPVSRLLNNLGPFTPPSDPELTGKPAPEFALKDVDGREVTLASLRGKPVLLDFWATWCAPCREEMPHIKTLHDQFKDQGLTVVCIDTNETADKAKKYFEENHYSFVNLLDSADVSAKYGAGGIPRVVLIDKDGVVRYFHRGWSTGMDLAPEVKKLLN